MWVLFFFFVKQHIGPSKESRILGLMLYVLRDWAWFTAAKLGQFRTKYCTKCKSYNTYILTYRKHIRIEQQGTVKKEIMRKKSKVELRDWAWFTATKLGRFRTKCCTKCKSYNTYILTYKKHIRIEQQGTVKKEIMRKKVK